MIVLVCGLPGVGKTSIAKEIARITNWAILSTDKIRKELTPNPNYGRRERRIVYVILMLIAKYLQNYGINCILDATFNTENSRKEIKEKLNLKSDQMCIVECVCPEDIVISRLENRKNDFSDADATIYRNMKAPYEPVKEEHIVVDTSQKSPSANAAKIVSLILRNRKSSEI